MRSLYNINKDYINLIENGFVIDEETGEIIFDSADLDKLNDEFETKLENVVSYIKNLEALSGAIKGEIKALDERLKANDKQVEKLIKYVVNALELRQTNKIETPRMKLSFRTSKSVNVVDEKLIPDIYFKETIERKLNKSLLAKDLKDKEIAGCFLLEKKNLQIK